MRKTKKMREIRENAKKFRISKEMRNSMYRIYLPLLRWGHIDFSFSIFKILGIAINTSFAPYFTSHSLLYFLSIFCLLSGNNTWFTKWWKQLSSRLIILFLHVWCFCFVFNSSDVHSRQRALITFYERLYFYILHHTYGHRISGIKSR